MQNYQVTVSSKDGQPISPAVRNWLDLPVAQSAHETFRVSGHASLREHLTGPRHPLLGITFRAEGRDGVLHGPVITPVQCMGDWMRYDLDGSEFFIYEKDRGRERFQVLERGAGSRGMARQRGAAKTLPAALELAASLEPSTTAEILADIEVYGDRDRETVSKLARLATPGTRLWILPMYGEHGYQGTGQPATALGLGIIGIEAMFGTDLGCRVIRYRTDAGEEGTIGSLIAMTAEEAAALWWVVDDRGNLLTGGHADKDRMTALASKAGGHIQHGLGGADAAAA